MRLAAILCVACVSGCVSSRVSEQAWPFQPPTWYASRQPVNPEREQELRRGPTISIESRVIGWTGKSAVDGRRVFERVGLLQSDAVRLNEAQLDAVQEQAIEDGTWTQAPRVVVWPEQCVESGIDRRRFSNTINDKGTEIADRFRLFLQPVELHGDEVLLRYAYQGRGLDDGHMTWSCGGEIRATSNETYAVGARTNLGEPVIVLITVRILPPREQGEPHTFRTLQM